MANSGIERIDKLLDGQGAPIGSGETSADAVGVIQDLLRGHGQNLPGLRGSGHGNFGPRTQKAVQAFCKANGLPSADKVDKAILEKLRDIPGSNPIVSRAYLTLVLDRNYKGIAKLVSLVSIVEGAGRFSAMCLNTDQAGLSIGIIQWAQKPKRLLEIVTAWNKDAKDIIRPILGYKKDDDAGFKKLLDHLNSDRGGTKKNGESTDANFELTKDPWKSRFRNACLNRKLQLIQLDTAIEAFKTSYEKIKNDANMSAKLTSERAIAFTLDLANQFGDRGAKRIFDFVFGTLTGGETEQQILEKMRDRSVKRLEELFPKQPAIARAGRDRRDFFLTYSGLSTSPFEP